MERERKRKTEKGTVRKLRERGRERKKGKERERDRFCAGAVCSAHLSRQQVGVSGRLFVILIHT